MTRRRVSAACEIALVILTYVFVFSACMFAASGMARPAAAYAAVAGAMTYRLIARAFRRWWR